MTCKKSILIAILVIFLFSISIVSAADANDTTMASGDDAQIVSIEESNNIETINDSQVIGETNNEEIIKDSDDRSFYALDQLIQNGQGTIKLEHDYEYEGYGYSDGILISKKITIDGQGHTIDAKNQARIFNIQHIVTLKNIRLMNGNSSSDYGGGAIVWYGNNGTVYNCCFENNYASDRGGAISWYGHNGHISKSIFMRNYAANGGAISWFKNDNDKISDSLFAMNNGIYGGAILLYETNNCQISNTNFTKNNANYGGAIYSQGSNGNILSNCNFMNNSATDAGAVYLSLTNDDLISDCVFEDNNAETAGALELYANNNVCISNSVFNYNMVNTEYSGGSAIFASTINDGYIFNCSFKRNYAKVGGTIYWTKSNGTVSCCNFDSNNVGSNGGAIYWDSSDNGMVSNCSFFNNCANDYGSGGAIFWYKSDYGQISDCSFSDDYANTGGAICWHNSDYGQISGCSFVDDYSSNGGAICLYESNNANIIGSVFLRGISDDIIYVYNSENAKINNNMFIGTGGLRDIYCSQTGNVNSTVITPNCNADYNWFGGYVTEHPDLPTRTNLILRNWLLLDAEFNPDTITVFNPTNIVFKLKVYNYEQIQEYDNSLLKDINLTIASPNGYFDKYMVNLGETVRFTATNAGEGSVTAAIDNNSYTFEFDVGKADPNLTVPTQQLTYLEDANIRLNYNVHATGIVDLLLLGKNCDYFFPDFELSSIISLNYILYADEYYVTAKYYGDENFLNAESIGVLKVKRATPNIIVSANNVTYGKDLTVTVQMPNDATRRPTVTIGDETKTVTMRDSIGTVKFSGLAAGTYTVIVTYNGDSNYAKTSVETTAKVKGIPEIIVSANDVGYGSDLVVVVQLPSDATRRPTVTIGDESKLVTMKNGKGNVKFSGLAIGTYDISVSYNGDANYAKASTSATAKVKPIPDISVSANDISYGEDLVVTVQMPVDATRRPTVTIGDESKLVTMKNGIGTVKFSGIGGGTHTVVASYNGDSDYGKASANTTVKVNRIPSQINVTANTIIYGDTAIIEIQLPSDVTRRATVTIDDVTKTVSLTNGVGYAQFTGLTAGTHTVTVNYAGDEQYFKSSATATLQVNKATPDIQITASNIKYGQTLTVSVQLPADVTKRAVVTIDGVSKYASLTNGAGSVKFTDLATGAHVIEVSYAGDVNYKKASNTTTITVKP